MLALALPDTISTASTQIQQILARGERVWMTADLHLCHANVIRYCNRPFANVTQMNEHLVAQTQKVKDDEEAIRQVAASIRQFYPRITAIDVIAFTPGEARAVLGAMPGADVMAAARAAGVDGIEVAEALA